MRLALIPLRTEPGNPAANLEHLAGRLAEAAPWRPDLVCLPECTLTGYLYEESDLARFAEAIPGPTTAQMGRLAAKYGFSLCFGLLEKVETGVYNSAVLLDKRGHILLVHRKIQESPPFLTGDQVTAARVEGRQMGVLLCGDLFNEQVTARLDRQLDLLLVPMSRSFADRSPDPDRWLHEERQVYLNAVRAVGVQTALVNALEDLPCEGSFGGALIVGADGTLLAESPHGTDRLLVWDLEPRKEG